MDTPGSVDYSPQEPIDQTIPRFSTSSMLLAGNRQSSVDSCAAENRFPSPSSHCLPVCPITRMDTGFWVSSPPCLPVIPPTIHDDKPNPTLSTSDNRPWGRDKTSGDPIERRWEEKRPGQGEGPGGGHAPARSVYR